MTDPRVSEDLVIDADVFVDALIHPSELVSPQPGHAEQHSAAIPYIEGLRSGAYRCHAPRLCLIEVCATVRRVIKRNPQARAHVVKEAFLRWGRSGFVVLHDIDEEYAARAVDAAIRYNLRAADATYAALADALSIPLKTRDNDLLTSYAGASRP